MFRELRKVLAKFLIVLSLAVQFFSALNLTTVAQAPVVKEVKQVRKKSKKVVSKAKAQAKKWSKVIVGKASWYGGGSRNYAMTAAMRGFRGHRIKVVNLVNRKSIIVRVNDYGPQRWTGRVIDLSRASFARLASTRQGVIPKVKLYVLKG